MPTRIAPTGPTAIVTSGCLAVWLRAYKPTTTTSAKSAETAVSRESKQATEAKQEIARKEKDATAQQTLARTQRETDVTI